MATKEIIIGKMISLNIATPTYKSFPSFDKKISVNNKTTIEIIPITIDSIFNHLGKVFHFIKILINL